MPHKDVTIAALSEFYRTHQNAVNSAVIAFLCVIARAFYTGSKWREIMGDVIFCPLIAVLLGSRLPELSFHGFTVDHTIVAAVVGTGGMHLVKLVACWAVKRNTGVSLTEKKDNG